jgi:hypothetical protein
MKRIITVLAVILAVSSCDFYYSLTDTSDVMDIEIKNSSLAFTITGFSITNNGTGESALLYDRQLKKNGFRVLKPGSLGLFRATGLEKEAVYEAILTDNLGGRFSFEITNNFNAELNITYDGFIVSYSH